MHRDVKILKMLGWIGAAGLFVLAVTFVTRSAINNVTFDLTAPGGTLWDFRDAGYYPLRAIWDGIVPYDVSRYLARYPVAQEFPVLPPMYMVMHAPYQVFDFPTAAKLAFGANLIGMVLLAAWSLRLGRYRVSPLLVLTVSGLLIVSNGGRNALHTGQASALFVAACYLALTAQHTAPGSIGIFGSLIKPSFGLPITILLAAAGRYRRAVVGTVAAVIASVLLMAPIVVWAGGVGDIIEILRENAAYSASSPWVALASTTARVDLASTFAMLTSLIPSTATEVSIAIVVYGAAAFVLFRRRPSLWIGHHADAVIVLVCLAVIIGFYHSFYDLVILVLPTVLVTRVDFAGGWAPTRYRLGLLIAMLIACFNPFRFGPLADALEGSPTLFRVLSPGLTGLALATAFALALVVVYRLPEPVTGHVGSDESDHFTEPL